jgi:hypothetical protein
LTDFITKELVRTLSRQLDGIIKFGEVIEEWPDANRSLKLPCLTVLPQDPEYKRLQPWLYEAGTPVVNKATVKYIVGEFDWKIDLHIWAKSKDERADIQERMFQAFHSQDPIGGLSLSLEKYHNIIARYDYDGYSLADTEESSQRKEWRVIIRVTANCYAVSSQKQYLITQEPELQTDIKTTELES